MNFINMFMNNTDNTDNTNSEKEKEMFFVFIINDKYVRWEIFSSKSTVNDVYNLLQTKYHVKYCTIYMNEIEISRYKLMKLSTLCKKDGDTMYISTDENYTLSSSIK